MSARGLLAVVLFAAGCPGSKGTAPTPTTGSDSGALCADLDLLVAAAAGNFVDQRTGTAVQQGGLEGVASSLTVSGAQRCAILHPSPDYPDDMLECDLADPGSRASAEAVLATWAARVGGCPVVATWAKKSGSGGAWSWEHETDDNHLLEVQLDVSGEEPAARPVLWVRRPEI